MSRDPSQTMRALLAQQGVFLEETRKPPLAPTAVTVAPLDGEAIRNVLLERGAPTRDLDWLVASCPSMAHALAFDPTPWMRRDFADYLDTERPSGMRPAGKGRP